MHLLLENVFIFNPREKKTPNMFDPDPPWGTPNAPELLLRYTPTQQSYFFEFLKNRNFHRKVTKKVIFPSIFQNSQP